MSGIEKVCEATADGHWYGEFSIYDKKGKSIYRDNIQVCPEHRKYLRRLFVGKPHSIKVRRVGKCTWDFSLVVEGVPCPFTTIDDDIGDWYRWFNDKRRWKRNMKKLLSVRKLNIR